MKTKTIRIFVLLALVSLVGIVVTQVYWFKKAYDTHEYEFNKNIKIALKEVVRGILKYNNTITIPVEPVQEINHNYFAVMVNDVIHADVLEHYLQVELKKFNIRQSFEYSIYDCENRKIVYGGYVQGDDRKEFSDRKNLPNWKGDNYYFTIYFPHKTAGIVGQMALWLYSSGVLLLVVTFFCYSLFVILRQKRLSEIQREFINNMTHEFKTPLSTIAISAATLKTVDMVNQPQRLLNYATIIEDEVVKLKARVERVLSIAETENRLALSLQKLDVHGLLQRVATEMCNPIKHKKVELSFALNATKKVVLADEMHMENLVSNILDNAIKYSGDEVQIQISSTNSTKNVVVQFSDNGIGISHENQKQIFDKFYRVPTGNLHDVKGFGIGLNYVKLIAIAHKGSIKVSSQTGKGTTFTLTLPLA